MPKAVRLFTACVKRFAAATLAAFLAACASAPPADPDTQAEATQHGTMEVIGHHCDGGSGIDSLAVHVDKPGIATIQWSNKNVCGDPA